MDKKFCVDAGNPRLNLCFERKESALQYARTVSRLAGKRVRVLTLAGALRRKRRRRR